LNHIGYLPIMTKPRTPARRIRSDGWTLPRQRLFIKMLAVTGSVAQAADAAGMSSSSAHRLRLHPEASAFRVAWKAALCACTSTLRETAFDRAINGTMKPVYENGLCVGREPVFNDRLLMFLLRQYDKEPERIAEQKLLASFEYLIEADDPEPEDVTPVLDADIDGCVGNASELEANLSGSIN